MPTGDWIALFVVGLPIVVGWGFIITAALIDILDLVQRQKGE